MIGRLAARRLDFDDIRREFGLVDEFPADALEQARSATDSNHADRRDRTDIPFVTIDPPESMDLDQAMHIERRDDGFLLHYAIADVGSVVVPGGALDRETRRRGQTFYLPDGSIPLHPRELSEGSASLLPEQTRPAALWSIELDSAGSPVRFDVTRASVRSVRRFDYHEVQADADAERLHPSIAALPELGELRRKAAIERGAIELALPEQEVVADGAGGWRLLVHPRTEADGWNAEISLLTGMCAAQSMIEARIGLLRTLPPASTEALDSLRRTASALGVPWPSDSSAGAILASLDPASPATLALMSEATRLLRGADYQAFDGALPEQTVHAGIGAPYAHVTAPLRRLSDRFATEVCLAVSAGKPVPHWVREALSPVAETMRGSDTLASKVERACVDRTEASVLAGRVGESFDVTVTRGREGRRDAEVFLADPPVLAACSGEPPEGSDVTVTLESADVASRTVRFGYPPDRNPSVALTR